VRKEARMKLSSVRVSIEEQWRGEGKERNVGGARFIGKSENGFAELGAAIGYLEALVDLADEDAKSERLAGAVWDMMEEVRKTLNPPAKPFTFPPGLGKVFRAKPHKGPLPAAAKIRPMVVLGDAGMVKR
jgi:hypothetical protein